ncbi:hypothetical protein AA984_04410 [Brevibacillus formosus]|uniref:Uncharacterized protein n=2 Tax=Brevibacillus formosus TaxID=54913 RepID=A0A837KVU4_9BACL|nr:hypothetical protein [Brevibacillus formosus]KLI01157.1 hypothetical protein AA984_04410 [Brevibacillus formosus]MED1955828.1 hypothetical protein [Brevibacillus formosus]PSK00160.1 hypothetical protein C7R91_00550 [Brevibacillus formosus]
MKPVLSIMMCASLLLSSASAAIAAKQNPNATVFLGTYEDIPFGIAGWLSEGCEATKSTMKLTVSNSSGEGNFQVQRRTSKDALWLDLGTGITRLNGQGTYTDSLSTTVGYEYRIVIIKPLWANGSPKGAVYCD